MKNFLRIQIFAFCMLFIGIVFSCTERDRVSLRDYDDVEYELFEVDNCEYVVFNTVKGVSGVHKANCKNPIHK